VLGRGRNEGFKGKWNFLVGGEEGSFEKIVTKEEQG